MRGAMLASFVAAVGLITWDELAKLRRWPHPERYVSAVLIWIVLGFLQDMGLGPVAPLFGWGLVITLYYQYYNGGQIFIAKPSGEKAPATDQRNS